MPAAPFGLFTAAAPVTLGQRETGGITYQLACDPATAVWPMPCNDVPVTGKSKPFPDELDTIEALPFSVVAGHGCPPIGQTAAEHQQWAVQRLTDGEQHTVESVAWDGTTGVAGMATSSPTVLGDAAGNNLIAAVSLLEAWLRSTTPETGMIHASAAAAAWASHYGQVYTGVPGRLTTFLQTTWVFGGGYPATGPHDEGTDPAPVSAGQFWMFATRALGVRRSEVIAPATYAAGALDLATNKTTVLAERIYVVDIPCDVAAVLVDTGKCACDGGTP